MVHFNVNLILSYIWIPLLNINSLENYVLRCYFICHDFVINIYLDIKTEENSLSMKSKILILNQMSGY